MTSNEMETVYPSLSQSQKKIACYVEEYLEEAVFLSINQLADNLALSPASIVRFTRAVGYQGYTDYQKYLRSRIKVVRVKPKPSLMADGPALAAKASTEAIQHMFQTVDIAQMHRVGDAVMTAQKVLIVGYMDSFGTASELVHRLYGMRDSVYFTRLINDWDSILKLMTPDTLVLAVSFAPHYQYTHTCVTTAKERGCQTMLITDNAINPLSEYADEMLVFPLSRAGRGTLHKQLDVCPVFAYIHYMFCDLAAQYPERKLDESRYQEKFVDEFRQ